MHSSICLFFSVICPLLACLRPVSAHDLPYGQVERAIQVTAYPDRIEVQYRFGLHERMLWEQLYGEGESERVEQLDRHELAKLEADYLAQVARELPTSIELEVGGERQECVNLTTEMIYQHHLQFECRLDFSCPSSAEPNSLQLIDTSFSTFPGHYRMAVRGRGGIEATSDTAALLLVRAPRLPIQAELRGQLVVPPIQATFGKGLGRETSRLVASRVESDQRSAESSQKSEVSDQKSEVSDQKSEVKGPRTEKAMTESWGESVGSAKGPRAEEKPKRLPGWLLASFVVLATIACLPLLCRTGKNACPT